MICVESILQEVVDRTITEQRAIEISNSEWWNNATDLQIAYIQLHQPLLICNFHRFHQACERVIDSPIQSMSFGMRVLVDKLTQLVDAEYNKVNK